jgi:MFS transporter, UMF1 family
MEINQPKVIRAWCMYDWANSVYSLTITTAIFPIYFASVTTSEDKGDIINFFGIDISNTVLYSFSLSFSFLFTAAIIPLLTGVADYSGRKKLFMRVFAYLGSFSCGALFFFDGPNIEFGIVFFILASIGYSGSLVFYDSFLPEIVSKDNYDRVSALGYSYGYVGSVILLIFNLVVIQFPEWFGLEEGALPAKLSFLTVGIWWFLFSHIPFHYLPKNTFDKKPEGRYLSQGYLELKKVWNSLQRLPELRKFLLAFFFYTIGVQTIMYLAALFGSKELGLEEGKLIITVLIIQIVAIAGAYLFARLSSIMGNKFSLVTMVLIWIGVSISAYFVAGEYEFYVLAFTVGMIMGGIQALSRASYSKLIPQNTQDHASYFSFYDVAFNVAIVTGTFSYGLVEQITGSMRISALVLTLFFLIGLFFLLKVKFKEEVLI